MTTRNRDAFLVRRPKSALLATTCLALVTIVPGAALAQGAAAANDDVEAVVVTGSRVVTNGVNAPTPVTVVSTEQLQLAAPRNMVDGILQLPQFRASVSVANQANGTTLSNGSDYLNLRGLGTSRTLVLLDGRRMAPNQNTSAVDAAQIPEALVKRVDIVTGGASAQYGSDAVAGVANFILDNTFKGLKANAQTGISTYGDNLNYKFDVTAGQSFANDRLHVVGSVLHYKSEGVPTYDRPWTSKGKVAITNPAVTATNPASALNPKQIVVVNGNSTVAANGGLITNTILRGTTFNPDGTPRPFQYGDLVSSTQMRGSDPGTFNPNLLLVLQAKQVRDQFYLHTTYDVSDKLSIYGQVLGARNKIFYHSIPTFELSSTAYTIFADNAFLPASLRQTMAANNIGSFSFGRLSDDIAIPSLRGNTQTGMATIGFDGKVGDTTWSYHGYGQMGRSKATYYTLDDPISDNLYRSADAVFAPNGSVVCRSTLTNPTNGCVPMNLFGYGAPSQASKDYVLGTAFQGFKYQQDVVDFSANGEVFQLPAGPVQVAFGGSYRRERLKQTADLISQQIRTGAGINGYPAGLINTLGGFERTNPQPAAGRYSVKEAFIETEVPIFKEQPFAYSLTLNAAARYVDYSTSGGVKPWKVGLVYQPFEWLRFRGTKSTDIRAPNLGELYRGSSQGTANVTDPFANNASVTVLTGSVGNTNLKPEIAKGTTLGVVFTPVDGPLSGLNMSVDYYKINISDAISTLSAQQELTNCFQGVTEQCGFIIRGNNGALARITLPFFNASYSITKGVDAEISYTMPLSRISSNWNGRLTTRMIVNYLDELRTAVVGAVSVNQAGDVSASEPKWLGSLQANLDLGKLRIFAQERYVGGGNYTNSDPAGGPVTAASIDKNHVGAVFYTDFTVSYDITQTLEGFVSVNNVFDRDPPMIPGFLTSASNFGNSPVGGVKGLYDFIGRSFTVGLHYKM